MKIDSTRLRAFQSEDLETLLVQINNLGFKIEIKGQPIFRNKKWILFGVLPENDNKRLSRMPMVVDFD